MNVSSFGKVPSISHRNLARFGDRTGAPAAWATTHLDRRLIVRPLGFQLKLVDLPTHAMNVSSLWSIPSIFGRMLARLRPHAAAQPP